MRSLVVLAADRAEPNLLTTEAPPSQEIRSAEEAAEETRRLLRDGTLDLALPGVDTVRRWAALARLGRTDLTVARLAEGHTDAVAILAEAGREPTPGTLYGVWAARSGGTGAELVDGRLLGTVRFCSGLSSVDRALIAAAPWLVEVDLATTAVRRTPETWQAIGMAASDSGDLELLGTEVADGMRIGPPNWYTTRRGFPLGGAGVAAVWLGGAAGVLDDLLARLGDATTVDEHQLAHLGALHTTISATDALLAGTARAIDAGTERATMLAACRAAAEHTAREVLDRAPRITGASPLCRDRRFAQRLADLQVYVRQHHAERDLAALGGALLAERDSR